MASLYSASSRPMASSSSAVKARRLRSWRTERMAFCVCQRQSSHWSLGTSCPGGVAARPTRGFVVVEGGRVVRDRRGLQRSESFRFAHTGAMTSVVGCPGVLELPQSHRRVLFGASTRVDATVLGRYGNVDV